MTGVYGDFIEVFPELFETLTVWTKDDKSDSRNVRAIYIPTKGSGIKRRKYTSGNTGLDITESDFIYTSIKYKIVIGEYFYREREKSVYRVITDVPYDKAAGYAVYEVERVTGTSPDKTEELKIKEAYFA